MKKIVYILFALFLFNACDVNVDNPNTITTATFWKTETDAQYGINAVYNMFYKPGTYSRWLWFRLDLHRTKDLAKALGPNLKSGPISGITTTISGKETAGPIEIATKRYSGLTRCCTTFLISNSPMRMLKIEFWDRRIS